MKALTGFLKEANGQFSSTRLFAFLIVLSMVVDYQHAIWTVGAWHPDMDLVGILLLSFGAKVAQKPFEKTSPPAPLLGGEGSTKSNV